MSEKDKKISKDVDDEDMESVVDFTPDEDLHPDVIAALKLNKKTKPNPTEYVPAQEEELLENETISTLY